MELLNEKFKEIKRTLPLLVDEKGWIIEEKSNDEFTAQFFTHNGVLLTYIWFHDEADTRIFEDVLNHSIEKKGLYWRHENFVISKNVKEGDCFVIKYLDNEMNEISKINMN